MNHLHLTPHETLELHEIVKSDITAVKKVQASLAMVTDEGLKSLMQQTLETKKDMLKSYQGYLH